MIAAKANGGHWLHFFFLLPHSAVQLCFHIPTPITALVSETNGIESDQLENPFISIESTDARPIRPTNWLICSDLIFF